MLIIIPFAGVRSVDDGGAKNEQQQQQGGKNIGNVLQKLNSTGMFSSNHQGCWS